MQNTASKMEIAEKTMKKTANKMGLATVIIVISILFFYVMQMSPSPLLISIKDYYSIHNNDMLLNMSASIIFPFIVLACLVGAGLEQKIGTRNLFTVSAILVVLGGATNLIASNYTILLVGRSIFGLGFGFSIPFIGSAIMKYYDPVSREKMNTLNGMYPFLGTVICFLFAVPISNAFGSFKISLAIWTVPIAVLVIIWMLLIKEKSLPNYVAEEDCGIIAAEKGLYLNLWRRKEIKLLCITFMCDFVCYSYVAVIVPTLFFEATSLSQATAGLMAAIAFPAFGIAGSSVGGVMLSKTGLRKPALVAGQIGKFVGICIATFGCGQSALILIAGISIFGFSNGIWMPAMYCVPMDLKNMNPTRVGASFSLMSACGLISGFIAPAVGGWLTNFLMGMSGIANATANHVFGLRWSLFAFGFVNIIGAICMIIYKETGIRRKVEYHYKK